LSRHISTQRGKELRVVALPHWQHDSSTRREKEPRVVASSRVVAYARTACRSLFDLCHFVHRFRTRGDLRLDNMTSYNYQDSARDIVAHAHARIKLLPLHWREITILRTDSATTDLICKYVKAALMHATKITIDLWPYSYLISTSTCTN